MKKCKHPNKLRAIAVDLEPGVESVHGTGTILVQALHCVDCFEWFSLGLSDTYWWEEKRAAEIASVLLADYGVYAELVEYLGFTDGEYDGWLNADVEPCEEWHAGRLAREIVTSS
jgi:hypothetical protein